MRAAVDPDSAPLALVERDGAREIVTACNDAARTRGVRSGDTVTAARALCSRLDVLPHEPHKDRRLLESLAALLQRYTPDVYLDRAPDAAMPAGLLLEIGRTAFHFGGEGELAAAAAGLLERLGHRAAIAVASRPAAASAVARIARSHAVHVPGGETGDVLAKLPRRVLDPTPEADAACELLGLTTVGELAALPRAGLTARLGPEVAERLELLLGEKAETLERFRAPETLREEIEWWPPSTEVGPLSFAAKRLFDLIEARLEPRERAVVEARLELILVPSREKVTVPLRPTRPTLRAASLLRLLQHRLEVERLPAPVDRMILEVRKTVPLRPTQETLFGDDESDGWSEEAFELMDRLKARLGPDGVVRPMLVAEHRPERAFGWGAPGPPEDEEALPAPLPRRPVRLEEPPVPLGVEADEWGRPLGLFGGRERSAVRLVSGPERIESGWWDGRDAKRRYFEVETPTGIRLWVFQDLATRRWYRHGLFE